MIEGSDADNLMVLLEGLNAMGETVAGYRTHLLELGFDEHVAQCLAAEVLSCLNRKVME